MNQVTERLITQGKPVDVVESSGALPAVGGARWSVRDLWWRVARRSPGNVAPKAGKANLSRFSINGYLLSFIFLVGVPSIASAIYFASIASDQYVAETRFAVRTLSSGSRSDKVLSSLAALGGHSSMSNQDAYIVTSYAKSRAIVDDISKTVDLRAIFTRPEADFWARLSANASIDELVQYWTGMVDAYVDGPSGIVTVGVRAFRPEDALLLSKAVLVASEKLVNNVSARARGDAMRKAEQEVRIYEGRVRNALLALRNFRDREGFIDPVSEATSTSKLLMDVLGEKIKLQNEYFVASRAMSPEAPSVQTLRSQLKGLDDQIEKLKSQLTGNSSEGPTVSKSLAKFEELELNRVFAEKLYSMSQDSLERARLRAEQQNIYVSVFVPPSLPQDAKYPERVALSFIFPISLLVIWGVLALVAASIEDHRI